MKIITGLIILFTFFTFTTSAQIKSSTALNDAIEKLRLAMIDAKRDDLQTLTSEHLSYGHSGGHVDDKKSFIEEIVSGKSDFVSINLSEQTISIIKNIAIVRHKLDAVVNEDNQTKEVHLLVLLVWEKEHGQWKLLARQAVKKT